MEILRVDLTNILHFNVILNRMMDPVVYAAGDMQGLLTKSHNYW